MPINKVIWEVNKVKFPVHIYTERRKSFRASIGKKAVLIRIPSQSSSKQAKKYLSDIKLWVQGLLDKDPLALSGITMQELGSEIEFSILGEPQFVNIKRVNSRYYYIYYDSENTHTLEVPSTAVLHLDKPEIEKMMMKYFRKFKTLAVHKLVEEVNQRTFNFSYKAVKLSLATSRWGSCSQDGLLNISTRLLLCPMVVIEYVIIHELAHLKEMNHSHRFWKLVESVMPDYRTHEAWLKKHRNTVRFLK